MTSLLPPHLSSSRTDSLPSLNLLCHSKTDARFIQDSPKAVWSIPYISVAFYPSLKQNFIAYRSFKVSSRPDWSFEIHQLWQSGFSRVYSNCYCCCWFEPEFMKIGQSSHKMYSNNILNIQELTTILNAQTKKSVNLLNAPHIITKIASVSFGEFRFQLEASCVSSHTEELWYNIKVCLWMKIHTYIYIYRWTPTHGRAKSGRPARTYIQQLCEDTGCCPEDLPGAMNDREEWQERVRDIRATSTTWWWWWWYIYIYIYICCKMTYLYYLAFLSILTKLGESLSKKV